MNFLWIVYWLMLFLNFVIGIIYLVKVKKIKWLGLLQSILTVFLAIWAFVFMLNRSYIRYTEIEYLYQKMMDGSIEAICLVVSFVFLIVISIRNIVVLKKDNV